MGAFRRNRWAFWIGFSGRIQLDWVGALRRNMQLPQITWYGSTKVRLKSFFLQASITNSMGDYTFSRLSSWPANLSPVNIPLPVPYGPGNEIEGIRVPLMTNAYSNVAFLINLGVDF